MTEPIHRAPTGQGSEGSPSPTLHSAEDWKCLRRQLPAASDATLNELVERYAFNVVWPALKPAARRQRLAALHADDKRQLLDQLFARMIEKLTDGVFWEGLS